MQKPPASRLREALSRLVVATFMVTGLLGSMLLNTAAAQGRREDRDKNRDSRRERDGERRERDRSEKREPEGTPTPKPTPPVSTDTGPKVAGFGSQNTGKDASSKVQGFNTPSGPPKTSASPSGSGGGSAPASTSAAKPAEKSGDDAAKIMEYAKALLKQYDEDKNGLLEREEWKKMKADHHAADINKDGIITSDELAAKMSGFAAANPESASPAVKAQANAGQSSGSGGSGKRDRHDEKTAAKSGERKTYRFLSATERLPKGLPDWFARNDADADGQVVMAEYAATFNDTVVKEFARFDLNADGIITPNECLNVLEREAKNKK